MASGRLLAALALVGVTGCTVIPPPPPPLVALPGPTKTQASFAQDDVVCRVAAGQAQPAAVAPRAPPAQPATPAASTAPLAPGSAAPLPLTPGELYLRCMASRNNVIQPLAVVRPAFYGFYDAYPVYAGFGDYYPFLYGGYFGGYYGGFRGGYYGGFHGGFGGGYGGGGFHGGGGGRR